MESIRENSENRHVAVFPFPFTSHPIAMLHLACHLASKAPNIKFSLFNTTKSNNSILSKSNLNLPANLVFYNLDDRSESEGLDMFQEMNVFASIVPESFKRGIDLAENQIGRRVTCFLTDAMFCYHINSMADERKVPWIALWALAPYSLPAFLRFDHIQEVYDKAEKPEDLMFDIVPGLSPVNYLDLPLREFFEIKNLAKDCPINLLFISMVENIHRALNLVMDSFRELNPDALIGHVKSKFQLVFFLGALTLLESSLSSDEDISTGCLSWLDKQNPNSVVYINCGTIQWSPEQCTGLAEALESLGVPFLWTLRDELKVCLPSGFLDRMKGKIITWSPQRQVLEHPSVCVFVMHGGYNSVLESAIGGVPMICCSVCMNTHMNAKVVEEVWEIGVRIEGRKITKEGMLKSFETNFRSEKGKKIKENAYALKQVLIKATSPQGVAAKDFGDLVCKISE